MAGQLDAGAVLDGLLEGNGRFASGRHAHPRAGADRRLETLAGQAPMAIVLACSDSRVPPEIVFDQGIGDLFVVRTAGNTLDDVALGSIEYAADHLGTNLLVVLGHSRCGAVTATVAGGEATGHVESIMDAIAPAAAEARGTGDARIESAVRRHIELTVEKLRRSEPVLAPLVRAGALRIVGAYYELESGKVEVTG